MEPALDAVRRMPKVLLHEHLDGGLRPATVVAGRFESSNGALTGGAGLLYCFTAN